MAGSAPPAEGWRRYAAPAAFLLAVTIAVILIRAGLESGGDGKAGRAGIPPAPSTRVQTTPSTTARTRTKHPAPRYWTVRAGDTFGVIASAAGVTVARIEQLNPKASSTSLHIGEKIRIR